MKKFKKLFAGLLSVTLGLSLLAPAASAATVTISEELTSVNRALSRKVATESMVLLENNGALPLAEGEQVAIFGGAGGNWHKGGNGSGDVQISQNLIYDFVEGMQEMETAGRIDVTYTNNNDGIDTAAATAAKNSGATTAIVVIDRNSSEGGDKSETAGDYYLNNNEKNKLTYINDAGFEKIIVILNTGRVIDMSWLTSRDYIDAILNAWQPGMYGGLATADVLLGDVNPSGKLTDTWVDSYDKYPTTDNFFADNYGLDTEGFNDNFWYTDYTEDIYVGYRYFETFDPESVIYEFGYGLSYTTFELSDYTVDNDGTNINVSVKVTNTGSVAGKEVVQVYFSAPQGVLGKPAKELAAFDKTELLEPGASETVQISFPIADMSSYDDLGKTGNESAYVLEAGAYGIYVGTSIRDCSEQGEYVVSALTVTEQLSEQSEPYELNERLINSNGKMAFEDLDTYGEMDEAGDEFITLNAEGTKRIEAEDCAFKQRYARASHNGTVCGLEVFGEGADGINFNWFDFYVYAPVAGSYELRLGYGRSDANAMRATVKVDDVYVNSMDVNDGIINIESTGNVWTIREHGPLTFNLTKGNHIVRVMIPEGGQNGRFDYVTFNFQGQTYATPECEYVPVEDPAVNKGITFVDVYNGDASAEELVDQMSYAELADLLSGNGNNGYGLDQAQGIIGSMGDYMIPSVQVCDGPAGVDYTKEGDQTAWPIGTAVASTWDTELITEMGIAFGKECQAVGVDLILTPGINIHRNPVCGRNFEYMSEDPLVTGIMSGALVLGLQEGGVSACLKHFVANERENDRYYTETRISERALREIYLKAFEIAIEQSDPDYLMTSYNRVNGEYTSESVDLVKNIIRGEWNWQGSIVTDWWNGANQALEIIAGNDLKMQTPSTDEVAKGLASGRLPRETVLECAVRVINKILTSGAAERLDEQMAPTVIEAEKVNAINAADFNFASSAVRTEVNAETGITSIGYFDNGAWVQYYLDVEEGAGYDLNMIVASDNRPNATVEVYVDDVLQATVVNNTGSAGWTDWKDADPVMINLPEGEHILKLVSPGDSINVQSFTLNKAVSYTLGDVDNDGESNVKDIVKLRALILADQWDLQQQFAGDFNGNGRLDVVDIVLLRARLLHQTVS